MKRIEVAFLKSVVLLGSGGSRTLSLNHLYWDGGEPTLSWQVSVTFRPVVTEVGTLHMGGDGGTVGHDIGFSAGLRMSSSTQPP
ncbi:hypothetical protein EYF80_017312 [Liparis tanakae]|uniref:Uncharacterized protein n=1 Tax=Liparis tanakae TaxID=230148 RepID=A0A4Z2I385_9TELE|nr:hypothetical protein EYF80_017312 [Liparis tanakae]